jgi:hypothetical protein
MLRAQVCMDLTIACVTQDTVATGKTVPTLMSVRLILIIVMLMLHAAIPMEVSRVRVTQAIKETAPIARM